GAVTSTLPNMGQKSGNLYCTSLNNNRIPLSLSAPLFGKSIAGPAFTKRSIFPSLVVSQLSTTSFDSNGNVHLIDIHDLASSNTSLVDVATLARNHLSANVAHKIRIGNILSYIHPDNISTGNFLCLSSL